MGSKVEGCVDTSQFENHSKINFVPSGSPPNGSALGEEVEVGEEAGGQTEVAEIKETEVEDTEVEKTEVEETEVKETEVEDTEVEKTEVEDTEEEDPKKEEPDELLVGNDTLEGVPNTVDKQNGGAENNPEVP